MSHDAVGRRYAQAIFELAKEEGSLAATAEKIADFAATFAVSDELGDVLENPLLTIPVRLQIVAEVASRVGATGTAERALRLIAKRRRIRAIGDIARHLRRLVDEDAKVLRAHVTTAKPPGATYLDRLRSEIEKATSKRVILTSSVDPSLIGGVVTTIGDRVVDGSLRSQLQKFRDGARPTV